MQRQQLVLVGSRYSEEFRALCAHLLAVGQRRLRLHWVPHARDSVRSDFLVVLDEGGLRLVLSPGWGLGFRGPFWGRPATDLGHSPVLE